MALGKRFIVYYKLSSLLTHATYAYHILPWYIDISDYRGVYTFLMLYDQYGTVLLFDASKQIL